MYVRTILTALLCGLGASALAATPEHALSFEARVTAQQAIERVNWSHRNWPSDNRTPKPPLGTVLPDDAIRAKVENYLKESAALESLWHRPITSAQLQAEINRMAAHTKDGAGLRELFDAVGNDPFVIAETIARPALAHRLIRNWYATDPRFHAATRRKAEAARAACREAACLSSRGGDYREATWSLRAKDARDDRRALRADDWHQFRRELARRLGGSTQVLEETTDAFTLMSIKEQSSDRIVVASVSWPKRTFESWWAEQRSTTPLPDYVRFAPYRVPRFDPTPCVLDTWEETSGAPDGHQGHTAVWTGSEMIIWGGWDAGFFNRINTGARYVPATDTWTPVSLVGAPAAHFDHAAVWTGSEMMVWGGDVSGGGRYDPATNTWAALPPDGAPSSCRLQTLRWTGSEVIVWGGECGSSNGARFSPSTNSWTPLSAVNAPEASDGSSVVWSGSELIVWGGSGASGSVNTGRRYNPVTDSWLPISVVGAPSPRDGASAVWTGSEMLVWGGGFDPGAPGTGGRYRPGNDTWSAMGSTGAPSDRRGHTSVWTGTEMIVWGSGALYGEPETGGRYRPSTDDWLATSTQGAPLARQSHSAVWTGDEMIVWGGYGNTGGRYDPATDSWVPTSTVPDSRSEHTAVWTGAELLVWGGTTPFAAGGVAPGVAYHPVTDDWSSISMVNAPPGGPAVWSGSELIVWGPGSDPSTSAGGRYSPANDSWIATSVVAAPSPRIGHAAVWTGEEMVVWGGGGLDTGGRYRPRTDTWVPTSTAGAPAPRSSHTAVWTGAEMIVWGGAIGMNAPGTGGRYSPATDSWTSTSVSGAPKSRYGHSAVWTGEDMIIWGGWNSLGLSSPLTCTNCWLSDGGRFDPVGNLWTATTEVGVPERRFQHGAVWTGEQMVVFGGNDDIVNLSNGGLYAPTQDAWTPTTLSGAPSPRTNHTATWTGRQMIVFGGYDYPSATGTGALYCACSNGTLTYRDADGDGFGSTVPTPSCDGSIQPGYVSNALDCDDGNGAERMAHTLFVDADGDGYGDAEVTQVTCYYPAGWSLQAGDCNDASAATHPGTIESCNAVDDDCNGSVDEDALGVDSDGDQVRNACDNCRSTFNSDQTDTDEDSVGNVCDNCIVVANAGQGDLDVDGLGDMCDNCATSFNPMQRDFDADRRGDACDNCFSDFNPSQTDFNADTQGDACDLNDGLIYIYSTDSDYVEWQEEDGQTRWNVHEGDLGILKSGGPYTQPRGSNPLADRHCNIFHGWVDDTEPVPANKCKFSLVTGVSGSTEGNLGTNSAGVLRPNIHPCP